VAQLGVALLESHNDTLQVWFERWFDFVHADCDANLNIQLRNSIWVRMGSVTAILTPFQRHFNAISTPFQRHFNAISTLLNAISPLSVGDSGVAVLAESLAGDETALVSLDLQR
jgi:hypothetical protein